MEGRARHWRTGQGEHFQGGALGWREPSKALGAWKAKACSEVEEEKLNLTGASCSLNEAP